MLHECYQVASEQRLAGTEACRQVSDPAAGMAIADNSGFMGRTNAVELGSQGGATEHHTLDVELGSTHG